MTESAPLSVADAVAEVVNSVSVELGYIGHLAEVLTEQAGCRDENRIEALALAIRRLAESVSQQLEDRLDEARRQSHG